MNLPKASGLFIVAALLAGVSQVALAQDVKPLYVRTRAAYPAPKLADVTTREFKHLFDANKCKPVHEVALKDLWNAVKAAAEKAGFKVEEKDKSPLKLEYSTKTYFDTPDQALWKMGYLIRITTKYKSGVADPTSKVTVKAILEDAEKALAMPLKVVGVDSESECQDNVGLGLKQVAHGYVEKGVSFTIPLEQLGKQTLGDFGKFMPELLKLGLPADTKLDAKAAWSSRIKPGFVIIPGTEPCLISMEAWSDKQGGTPYLYDFSFTYEGVDYYESDAIHTAGEAFLAKVLGEGMAAVNAPDGAKWGGSKVRKLFNRSLN